MVLAVDPGVEGYNPRVWAYRNSIKALNWYVTSPFVSCSHPDATIPGPRALCCPHQLSGMDCSRIRSRRALNQN